MRALAAGAALASIGLCQVSARAQEVAPLPAYPVAPASPPPEPPPPTNGDGGDSGLGLEWVYLNAEAGGSYVDMQSFSASNLGLQTTHAGGPMWGVGAGVRLLFFSFGARVRDQILSSLGSLWEIDGEAAFHVRVWQIDPYIGVRGGYVFLGGLDASSVQVATGGSPSDVAVHGFDVGPVVGIDLYLSKLISIGAEAEAEFLFLQRPPPALPGGITASMLPPQEQTLYENSGSSAGIGGVASAHLGIHF